MNTFIVGLATHSSIGAPTSREDAVLLLLIAGVTLLASAAWRAWRAGPLDGVSSFE